MPKEEEFLDAVVPVANVELSENARIAFLMICDAMKAKCCV